jgi:hypothetical protein
MGDKRISIASERKPPFARDREQKKQKGKSKKGKS